jgi:hypothetical protein
MTAQRDAGAARSRGTSVHARVVDVQTSSAAVEGH